jgi:hypothetical protein
MKLKITRRVYRACCTCRLHGLALRLYIRLHEAEDGY